MSALPWDRVRGRGHQAVLLIRHGRTAYNDQRRFLGVTDLALDAEGERQAAGLSARLPRPDAVYTSPLRRAMQSALALAPPVPVPVPALRELDHGALEGLDVPTATARYPAFFAAWNEDPRDVIPPGSAETLGTLQHGALEALQDRLSGNPDTLVACVTHQLVIAALSCAAASETLISWRRYTIPNVGITVLGWDGSALALEEVACSGTVTGPA